MKRYSQSHLHYYRVALFLWILTFGFPTTGLVETSRLFENTTTEEVFPETSLPVAEWSEGRRKCHSSTVLFSALIPAVPHGRAAEASARHPNPRSLEIQLRKLRI